MGNEVRLSKEALPEEIKGRAVVVAFGKKVPKGTAGVIFWAGFGNWGTRVGIRVAGSEEPVWTAAHNCVLNESPEGKAAEEAEAAARAEWVAAKKAEGEARKVKAQMELAAEPPPFEKGSEVYPSEGPYAKVRCRVIWVGATKSGVRVGVKPILKPTMWKGKPVWTETEPSWLPVGSVHLTFAEAQGEAA